MSQQSFLAADSDPASVLSVKLRVGITAAKAVVPKAIADDYDVVTANAATDFTAITAAEKSIDAWLLANCKYEVVKLTADDSSVSMPRTLKPGFVAFDVTNTGTRARYYGVVPVPEGQTIAQVVATPIDQLRPQVITQVLTTPGQEAVAYGPIAKPGVYVVIDGNTAGTAAPSFTSFTVKK